MGIQNPQAFIPLMKPLLVNFGKEMAPTMKESMEEMALNPGDSGGMREEIDTMLDDRLQYLTADAVKRLIEDVIRRHLHWLVIWGNVFGGFIGILSAITEWPSPHNTCPG